jgi:hypothetical protein
VRSLCFLILLIFLPFFLFVLWPDSFFLISLVFFSSRGRTETAVATCEVTRGRAAGNDDDGAAFVKRGEAGSVRMSWAWRQRRTGSRSTPGKFFFLPWPPSIFLLHFSLFLLLASSPCSALLLLLSFLLNFFFFWLFSSLPYLFLSFAGPAAAIVSGGGSEHSKEAWQILV